MTHVIGTTLVIAIVVIGVLASSELRSQQLRPIDEAGSDSALMLVRNALLAAATEGDEQAVRMHVAKDVSNGYDAPKGIAHFMKLFRKDLRKKLVRALTNGGAFHEEGAFIVPSLYQQFPDDLAETYTFGVIYGDSVNVREANDIGSEVIGKYSWEVVEVFDWAPLSDESGKAYEWVGIRTPDGNQGYVSTLYLWSTGDARFLLDKVDGVWKLTGWFEGD